MSKAALDHFTRTMATNLMFEGVKVYFFFIIERLKTCQRSTQSTQPRCAPISTIQRVTMTSRLQLTMPKWKSHSHSEVWSNRSKLQMPSTWSARMTCQAWQARRLSSMAAVRSIQFESNCLLLDFYIEKNSNLHFIRLNQTRISPNCQLVSTLSVYARLLRGVLRIKNVNLIGTKPT